MIKRDEIERAFSWRDFNNELGRDNVTAAGFIELIDQAFNADSLTYDSLSTRLQNITLWYAIENKLLNESNMDRFARQLRFTVWEFVGKFNLIAPYNTVLLRKQEMLKQIQRLMRLRGTAYAVEQILLAFGFTNVIIHENVSVPLTYDGTYDYDGYIPYSGNLDYQLFNVELDTTLDLIAPAGSYDEQIEAIA
ncbi:MAG: hypothetical protein GY869_17060, partial [Planctomycetes bacterium]|nr:hypothetical protein [Planctomycetota bacterium]